MFYCTVCGALFIFIDCMAYISDMLTAIVNIKGVICLLLSWAILTDRRHSPQNTLLWIVVCDTFTAHNIDIVALTMNNDD